ncbi:MAG: discoidin domain-containing protein [Thomasclavelia ramosa]
MIIKPIRLDFECSRINIYVELKGIYKISSIQVDWGNNYAPNYEIQISDDAQMWQTVKTIIDGQGGNEKI